MPTLQINPNEALCPDFASPDYEAARDTLINNTVDEEAATEILTQAWHANNTAEKLIWERQLRAELEAAAEREQQDRDDQQRREED